MPTVFNKLSNHVSGVSLQRVIAQDILGLLNCAVRSARLDLPAKSPVMSSVLNYGNPPWLALGSSRIDPFQMALDIQNTLTQFEPRLSPNTLKVTTRLDTDQSHRNNLYFDIQAAMKGRADFFRMRLALDYQGASFTLPEDEA